MVLCLLSSEYINIQMTGGRAGGFRIGPLCVSSLPIVVVMVVVDDATANNTHLNN